MVLVSYSLFVMVCWILWRGTPTAMIVGRRRSRVSDFATTRHGILKRCSHRSRSGDLTENRGRHERLGIFANPLTSILSPFAKRRGGSASARQRGDLFDDGPQGRGYRISPLFGDYLVLRNKLRKYFASSIFRATHWMADQEWPAHVPDTKRNGDRRGPRAPFSDRWLRINGLQGPGNYAAFAAAGRDLRGSQRRIGPSGMGRACSTSAAPGPRLAWIARPIPSGVGPKDPPIRIRQRDLRIPVLISTHGVIDHLIV